MEHPSLVPLLLISVTQQTLQVKKFIALKAQKGNDLSPQTSCLPQCDCASFHTHDRTRKVDLRYSCLSVCSSVGPWICIPSQTALPSGSGRQDAATEREVAEGDLSSLSAYRPGHLTLYVPGYQGLILPLAITVPRATCFSCRKMFSP